MVTIYTITYNEELMIEFFINHYRKKFPGCEIVVFDNYSTDKTVEIAKKIIAKLNISIQIIKFLKENILK
jgi:glycosyltransferase involved in cell wall biosynthesis